MDARTPALGTLIDKLDGLREKKRKLNEQLKDVEAEFNELQASILQRLEAEGMDKATGKKATVSRTEVIVATIVDFDALCAFVKKSGHFHLFQRRISDPAFRELAQMRKGGVPGLEAFTKTNLNLRSLKGA